jgi:hypothetical protein
VAAYDFYNAYLSITSTPKQSFRDEFQANVNSSFEIASDYYVIQKLNRTTQELEDIGVRLTFPYSLKESSTLKDDFRKIIFKDSTSEPKMGDLYTFNNYYYLCIDTGTYESVTNSCIVQRCSAVLKFTEATPTTEDVISIYAVTSKFTFDSLKQNQFIILPDNELSLLIPNDENGRKIIYDSGGGTRFLLGNPLRNWRTVSIDTISHVRPTVETTPDDSNGLIGIKLELSEINTAYDDLVNGVAWQDYW